MNLRITRHEHPARPDDPEMWTVEADVALWNAELVRVVGDDDMAETVPLKFAEGTQPQYSKHVRWVARDGEEVVGVGMMELPQIDNRHLAFPVAAVAFEHRGRGIGTALYEAMEAEAAADGRTELSGWSWVDPNPRGEVIQAKLSGAVAADDPNAHFMMARGYALNQVERISRLELPPQVELDRAVAPVDDAYELLTWFGRTPEEHLEHLAALHAAMSTDTPHGDADWEAEVVDEERVRSGEDSLELGDRDQLVTAVRHRESGDFVGFTRILVDRSKPEVGHQWETVVVSTHRGHGLGLAMKTRNHAELRRHWPRMQSLITGNAEENRHMLAINDAVGYRPYAATAWWLRKSR